LSAADLSPEERKKGAFAMLRRFRKSAAIETDDVRQGGGPLDNLVVLLTSLAILTVIGVSLIVYFGNWPLVR
jgi:hypothetical protein